jgi:transposase
LKKRHNYGSLLIDFQTRKVIDLIPHRGQEEVSKWLQTFPSLSYVIRDGAQAFRNAISDAFPDVIQIADRFHVLKSLTDHACKAIRKLIPHHLKINRLSQPRAERTLTDAQMQKQTLVHKVRDKKRLGWNFTQIGKHFNLDARTVKRYCDPSLDVTEDHQRENTYEIEQYTPLLQKLLYEHDTLAPVYQTLVEHGYSKKFITFFRTYKKALERGQAKEKPTQKVHRRPIIQLLFQSTIDFDTLYSTTQRVLKEIPEIKTILQFVLAFRKLLKGSSLLALDQWIESVKKLENKHLNSFINGVERDKEAIQNSIIYPELSNGLAEGKVNKLKHIKRVMFGRCHFETLKRKVLLSER